MEDSGGIPGQDVPRGGVRDGDSLASLAKEVSAFAARKGIKADASERDAMAALADRALDLFDRLQAIIDWADFAMLNAAEFDSGGVRNLDGPIFDDARAALGRALGRAIADTTDLQASPGRTPLAVSKSSESGEGDRASVAESALTDHAASTETEGH